MRSPDTLPPAAIERSTTRSRDTDRRWRPIDPDPDELVAVHRNLCGGGLDALARIVASPVAQAYTAVRADEALADGLRRMIRDAHDRRDLAEEDADG